ncbi:MAG: hypothetical protein Q8K21_02140 [Hydrogenophaga sp.]|uniref:hypothetical protein n=1 Tax=Hydrogenophaga sp. TaxID=1904254 RepID=UPI00272F7A98|nr:hypothetical protein [Hydrogenophaga sp.]MDP2163020.1 hypothetical protein [Hydrogenophaga sp.]
MGFASFSRSPLLSVLLAPLQALAALWVPAQPPASAASPSPVPAYRRLAANDSSATKSIAGDPQKAGAAGSKRYQSVARTAAPRRLKVVREFEPGISPSCAGRMVISGRMADVCAELERMAQREAALAQAA